jgi:hypothetical protein
MLKRTFLPLFTLITLLVFLGMAQEAGVDRFTIPLTQPDRPIQLEVNLMGATLTVKAGATKAVIVESRHVPGEDEDREEESSSKRTGLRRIPNTSTGLTIEEQDNVVSIGSHMQGDNEMQVVVQVPALTSAKIHLVNGGDVLLEGITGELEVQCTNGSIDLKNVGGSVVANAINGHVHVTFTTVAAGKPMSFSSLNGDIDVTMPADTKASLSLKADMGGDIYTDFDLALAPVTAKAETPERDRKGRYRVSMDRSMRGTVNGGGPEFTFKTFQGDIYLRKKK